MGEQPLSDVRVLAVEQYGAGPYGSLHLADLGAEVVKIEDPRTGGDVGRYVPPYAEDSLFFGAFKRNKRSISLDLLVPAGREAAHPLRRPQAGQPADRVLLAERVRLTGPRAAQPAYDHLIQALAGWMALTGEPDGPPTKAGLSVVDFSGGLAPATALLAGLHAARRDGVGTDCDVSLYDTGISMLNYVATWNLSAGHVPGRTHSSAHPSIVPFQAFAAADGWLVVACPKEKFWRRLTAVLDRADLHDERFATMGARQRHAAVLVPLLEEAFAARPVDAWVADLVAAGVPCAPVTEVADALADEHTAARDLIVTTEHPHFGTVRAPASPVRVGAGPVEHRRAPRRHEDADALLTGLLGYDAARVEALAAAGAFG